MNNDGGNDMDTVCHYLAGKINAASCGKSVIAIIRDNNEASPFARYVNCPGCTAKFAEMAALGFFPRN